MRTLWAVWGRVLRRRFSGGIIAAALIGLRRGGGGYGVDRAAFRNRRLKLAVATSVASKATTIIVQLLALPIAVSALGVSRYGVFVTIAAALAWMSITNVGVVRGLTRGIAMAASGDDRMREARYFSSAFIFVTVIALFVAVVVAVLIWFAPVQDFFGDEYAAFSGEIRRGLLLLCVLFTLQVIASVAESAQAGYQEQYINNLWGILGNVLSVLTLFVVAFFWPTISGMILAMYGVLVASKLMNFAHLIWFSHPHLRPSFRRFDRVLGKAIFVSGLAFFLIEASNLMNLQLSLLITGHFLGPESAGTFSIMVRLLALLLGVIVMLTTPLWPAITDALVRDEVEWVRSLYRKAILFSMLYAVAVGLAVAVGGRKIVSIWVGSQVAPDLALQIFMGVYFVLWVWALVHYTTLMGMGWLWRPAIVLISESLLTVPMALLLIGDMGNAGVAAALCIARLCLGSWALPLMTKFALRCAD